MFEGAIRNAGISGIVALSAFGYSSAEAQDGQKPAQAVAPIAAEERGNDPVDPFAAAQMPNLVAAPAGEPAARWSVPEIRYLSESSHGFYYNLYTTLVASVGAGMIVARATKEIIQRSLPDYRLEPEKYSELDTDLYQACIVTGALMSGAATVTGVATYVGITLSERGEATVNTIISDTHRDAGNRKMLISIPECLAPLEVPDSELFRGMKPGSPLRATFVIERDHKTVVGWYIAPPPEKKMLRL